MQTDKVVELRRVETKRLSSLHWDSAVLARIFIYKSLEWVKELLSDEIEEILLDVVEEEVVWRIEDFATKDRKEKIFW